MGNVERPSQAMQKVLQAFSQYITKDSLLKGLRFQPHSTDVIVCTPAKSGTTWAQQICHGLRSGGNMDFEEMSLVFPCLEMAHDYGYLNLQQPQPYAPRMYKSHYSYNACPKGAGKYIILVRRPSDSAVSQFHFLNNWVFSESDVSMEEFVQWIYVMPGEPKTDTDFVSHFHHIVSWYPHRLDDNVLWLHYEDLQQNLRECIRLIADFLEIGVGDEKLQGLVADQSNIDFMKAHASKFDEHPLKLLRNEAIGLPRDAGLSNNCGKVRSGEVYSSKSALPEYVHTRLQQKWNEVVTPETGYDSYEALRAGINNELGRSFT